MHSCIGCNRKISALNLKNLQCRTCNRYCHPNCARHCPSICLQRSGNFRYKIIRNKNWQCESCKLSELPFFHISDSQIKNMYSKPIPINEPTLPSCQELNELFVNNSEISDENDTGLEIELPSISNEYRYLYSADVCNLDFHDEVNDFESFPIVSMNIRSIANQNNFTKFEGFLENLSVKPLIIALDETWISKKCSGPYNSVPGYQFVHNSRKNSVGGGVAFYVDEKIHFNKIDALSMMKEKLFESIFIEIDINGEKIICGSVYRSPNHNHDEFLINLKNVLTEGTKLNKNVIIAGDFNYDLLDTDNDYINSFKDSFFEFGFHPLINIPTRITKTTAKLLDHVWTNILDRPFKNAVICNPISDHLPTYVNLGVEKSNSQQILKKRNFSEKNIARFNQYISELNVSDILKEKSTNIAYDIFIKRYLKVFNESFPLEDEKMKKVKFKRKWYTNDLKELNDLKERNYAKHISNKTNQYLESRYVRSRTSYFNKVKYTKKNFFRKLFDQVKNNVKKPGML